MIPPITTSLLMPRSGLKYQKDNTSRAFDTSVLIWYNRLLSCLLFPFKCSLQNMHDFKPQDQRNTLLGCKSLRTWGNKLAFGMHLPQTSPSAPPFPTAPRFQSCDPAVPNPSMRRCSEKKTQVTTKTTLWTLASFLRVDSRELECHLLFTCNWMG